jgi:hypothetical protein
VSLLSCCSAEWQLKKLSFWRTDELFWLVGHNETWLFNARVDTKKATIKDLFVHDYSINFLEFRFNKPNKLHTHVWIKYVIVSSALSFLRHPNGQLVLIRATQSAHRDRDRMKCTDQRTFMTIFYTKCQSPLFTLFNSNKHSLARIHTYLSWKSCFQGTPFLRMTMPNYVLRNYTQ